jgi:ubiquinone/menaquinone biosynthesis C-methylase UbiE
MTIPDWQWNEMQQVGTDYTDPKEIAAYDARMTDFRDVEAENRGILALLDLPAGASVLEIGCGTGRFSRTAAKAGLSVTAVDVSAEMLDYVAQRSRDGNLNIQTQHAGFLSMDLPAGSFDAAVSGAALHHLPDAWKLVALRNIARALKPGGQFLLRDVVFVAAEGEEPEMCLQRFADSLPTMREAAARHVAREFSTYDWIIEGLLRRAGFDILSCDQPMDNFMQYHCRKALSGKG